MFKGQMQKMQLLFILVALIIAVPMFCFVDNYLRSLGNLLIVLKTQSRRTHDDLDHLLSGSSFSVPGK